MRITILSDIHDNLWNLTAAIDAIRGTDVLICCGDLCSPFVIDQLGKFAGPVHIVFGNNDADRYRITRKSSNRVQAHGEFFEGDFDGKKVAVQHFDNIAYSMAASGLYDLVCYGHNHFFSVVRLGRTLAVNPGPIMGARFPGGQWEDVAPTFVVFDTQTGEAKAFEIESGSGQARTVKPHKFSIGTTWPDSH